MAMLAMTIVSPTSLTLPMLRAAHAERPLPPLTVTMLTVCASTDRPMQVGQYATLPAAVVSMWRAEGAIGFYAGLQVRQ